MRMMGVPVCKMCLVRRLDTQEEIDSGICDWCDELDEEADYDDEWEDELEDQQFIYDFDDDFYDDECV